MKLKAKKLLLALIILVFAFSLTACKGQPTYYYGAVLEDDGVLFVKMSNVEKAILPVKNGTFEGETVEIKAGDIIKMTFEGNCYFYDTTPKTFGVAPTVDVIKRDVLTTFDENGYYLTFNAELISGVVTESGKVGVFVDGQKKATLSVTSLDEQKITLFCETAHITALFNNLVSGELRAE